MITISGTVYDITAQRPIEAVAVLSSMGNGTLTDSLGKYNITVRWSDSIWFSMLGKTTFKYRVDTINNTEAFDIKIHLRAADLPEVRVRNKNYKLDSLRNREDYAKVFNFKKPSLGIISNNNYNPGGVGAAFDLTEIINMFRVKRNRSIAKLQQRLLLQEQEKYIDFRFNKNFVRKLTKLQAPEIDSFMLKFRPDYELVRYLNDLEFGYTIQKNFEIYKAIKQRNKANLRRRENN